MIDYKNLLKKYMRHVIDCEGISFVSFIGDSMSEVEFTEEEAAELLKVLEER